MQKHVKIYKEYFNIGIDDRVQCMGCDRFDACDIHHLTPRSLGGGNDIDNLCAVCRKCHERAHTFPSYNEYLKIKHLKYLNDHESA